MTDIVWGDEAIIGEPVVLIKTAAEKQKSLGGGFSCGFEDINQATQGFQGGDLVIVSGETGHGKTTWLQTLTWHFTKQKLPCLWFSYEVNIGHLYEKFKLMGIDNDFLGYCPLKNETGSISWIKTKIKEASSRFACKVIFIDHLGFLTPTMLSAKENYAAYITAICREIKTIAIECDVIIFLASHIKKINTGEDPKLSDLKDSSGIAQEADFVFFTARQLVPKSKNQYTENSSGDLYTNETKIILAKNRRTGQAKFITCELVNQKFIQITKTPNGQPS